MLTRLRETLDRVYLRHLRGNLDRIPTHVAVIQDGNRRYARERGRPAPDGHRAGADTTEAVLDWCADLGVEELTLYAFSTENFARPAGELEPLFELLETKIREFASADRVHERGVSIRAIGDRSRFPASVQEAIADAERRTAGYDTFRLNIALGYGGRNELLTAARAIARDVEEGTLEPADVNVETVEEHLHDRPVRDVDLIIRTGGDERTSNFLPWHANGNEAAVYFCAPYWPAFSEADFMRAIRTYQAREESWRSARRERAVALIRAAAAVELEEARTVAARLRDRLPRGDREAIAAAVPDGRGLDGGGPDGTGGELDGGSVTVRGEDGAEPLG
ncbi:polyprenyl diphosphate synthase [Halorubrum vacuolatum]|uniref:Tritrans,polycis-undecaprenyl-diphosphate synthase (geranylgeranyl-diphosphate specific) n=1 Tax=Halorubrum vacuolatum TaxID=63740 RepID=A0A238VSL4_HALVU|nr:polyprenyl diphosphate synthase [Halorubrum vacuolatum]SNR37330.1 Undecaprenyl pyrophosphate synthetase [Halorubrum vacuolatum]